MKLQQPQQEESIYNLLPKEYIPPQKGLIYRSRYSPSIEPSYSTFIPQNSPYPGIRNVSGILTNQIIVSKKSSQKAATLGYPEGSRRASPQKYLHKGDGSIFKLPLVKQTQQVQVSQLFQYPCDIRKQPLPKRDQSPIFGLQSKKNYVITNIVSNILSSPRAESLPYDWTKKKDYGSTPDYLLKRKEDIQRENKIIRELAMKEEEAQQNKLIALTPEEIQKLKEGLKKKWDQVQFEYQKLTHKVKMDTIKENYEKELAQLEKDMEKLNRPYVVIDASR